MFDYIDGGAEDERSLRNNSEAFARIEFRPRVLRSVGNVDPSTTLLGKPLPFPLVLAPTGFTRIADPEGELAVARAAERAGLPYTLSTLSTRSIEEVAAVSDGRLWFQVYVWRDRGLVKEMIDRCRDSGYEALVITVDTAVLGRRERDVRRGFSLPPKLGVGTLLDGAVHPGWTWAFVRADPIMFANVAGRDGGGPADGTDAVTLSDYVNAQFDPDLSWDDVDWLRSVWDGPIVAQGHPVASTTPCSPPSVASTPSPSPTTAGASSTRRRRRSTWSPRGRRRRRAHGDHLRRRGAAGERHRQGRRPRRHGVHGRPGLPLRARRGRRARRRPRPRPSSPPTSAARWPSSAPPPSPT